MSFITTSDICALLKGRKIKTPSSFASVSIEWAGNDGIYAENSKLSSITDEYTVLCYKSRKTGKLREYSE